MKSLSVFISVNCIFCLSFLMSCQPRTKTNPNPVVFDSIQIAETQYLHNDTAQPGCNLQISFVYPDYFLNKQLHSKLQSFFIEKVLGHSFAGLSPRQAVDEYTQNYFRQFEQSGFPAPEHADSDEETGKYRDETGFSCYTRLKNKVVHNQNGIISFTVESLSYEGGARSAKNIRGYVVCLATGEPVQEELFAGENYQENISRLLAVKIAEVNGLSKPQELENLGYDSVSEIAPNNNFTLDDKGITYYFNENEIACSLIGITRVFIPYNELAIYILQDSPLSHLIR